MCLQHHWQEQSRLGLVTLLANEGGSIGGVHMTSTGAQISNAVVVWDVMADEHVFGDHLELSRQEEINLAFSTMDTLLEEGNPRVSAVGCVNCGGMRFGIGGDFRTCTERVCLDCGTCQPGVNISSLQSLEHCPRKSSNYKRVHHFHERVSQLLLQESEIPDDRFLLIATKLCDGSHSVINKDAIRAVLRSLNLQIYIEKWLQIIWRVTSITPPIPGSLILEQLDLMFIELQRPFSAYKHDGRKNFLNYNYVFCRLFQEIGCAQFSMFFPLIKSKQKLKALDDMWRQMIESVGWTFKPLQTTPSFAVRLEASDFARICRFIPRPVPEPTWWSPEPPLLAFDHERPVTEWQDGAPSQAVTQGVQPRTGYRQSDRHRPQYISKRDQQLLRLAQPGQQFRTRGWRGRNPPWAVALLTQSQSQVPVLRLCGKPKAGQP